MSNNEDYVSSIWYLPQYPVVFGFGGRVKMNLHTTSRAIFSMLSPRVQSTVKLAWGHLRQPRYGWFGDYGSWPEAQAASGGYDQAIILERVKAAMLKVKRGEAAYERDSVVFERVEYSWPVLASLMWIAAQHEGRLSVLDFGGSLGSTYFQNRAFLTCLRQVRWSIVEQAHFVACGKEHFQDEVLHFYESLADCRQSESPDVVFLGSVLQYLEKPYEVLSALVDLALGALMIDRTPFSRTDRERLTIQRVPPSIYPASYPCWLLNEQRMHRLLEPRYRLVTVIPAPETANASAVLKGFLYERRSHA